MRYCCDYVTHMHISDTVYVGRRCLLAFEIFDANICCGSNANAVYAI